jgi:hypothetical protein
MTKISAREEIRSLVRKSTGTRSNRDLLLASSRFWFYLMYFSAQGF